MSIAEARNRAVALLARREHSRHELRRKLLQAGYEETVVEAALEELAGEGLQSDRRFAEIFIHSRVGRGQGPVRILRELSEHGVDASLAGELMEALEVDWSVLAEEVRRRRFGAELPTEWKERARQARFLEYRGFRHHHFAALLDNGAWHP